MAFEEYQFLRYFIPGSLYVIYTTALITPFLDPSVINFFENDPSALLGIVGGALGASLALGYIIYTFYDTFLYNRWAMNFENRVSLRYLAEKIEGWDDPRKPQNTNCINDYQKKMFLDMLWIGFDKDNLSERYDKTLRGMWSHLNARKVCYLFVPAFSVISFSLLVITLPIIIRETLFILPPLPNWGVFFLVLIVIGFISGVFRYGAKRPLNEGTTLEYFFIKQRIEEYLTPEKFSIMVKNLLGTEAKTKISNNREEKKKELHKHNSQTERNNQNGTK